MLSHLNASDVAQIDGYVNHFCSRPANYNELSQLHRLFTRSLRRGLERLLNRASLRGRGGGICDVQLAWIDKIPIARSAGLTRGTELGDAVLFAIEQWRDPTGRLLRGRARAAVLQAKIARDVAQLAAPSVPVGTGISSSNELVLLSNWPSFDLYPTAGSASPSLSGVKVTPTGAPPPEAWFIAAPGRGLGAGARAAWPCWWMAGQPSRGAACATTLGTMLVDFLLPAMSGATVGAPFVHRDPAPVGGVATPPDWSDLCNEIRRIAARYHAPPSVFGAGQPRVYSIPFWANQMLAHPSYHEEVLQLAANPSWRYADRPLGPRESGGDGLIRRGRMAVLSVTVTRIGDEGPRED